MRLRCLLRGHSDLLRFEKDRLYVECMDCRRQTAGWDIQRQEHRQDEYRIDRAGDRVTR
jgi:hypothetical protein